MQIARKHLGLCLAAACLLAALAFGAMTAQAEPGDWWPVGNTNTLTVNVSDDDSIVADLGSNVEVDLYLVATATPNSDYQAFDYKAVGRFEALGDPDNGYALPSELSADDWMALAQQAADIVYPEGAEESAFDPEYHGVAGSEITNLQDGIYLILVHGGQVHDDAYVPVPTYDVKKGYYAYNTALTKKYTFTPTLVALPNKTADEEGYIGASADYGEWLTSVTISTMKPEIDPLYGDLIIQKTLNGFVGTEEATFTFHIASTPESPYAFDDYRTISFAKGGEGSVTVEHIKAGTIVTVTEEAGTRYAQVQGDNSAKTILSAEAVEATKAGYAELGAVPVAAFVNEPDGNTNQGYGIENKFDLTKIGPDDEDWDWTWTQVDPVN